MSYAASHQKKCVPQGRGGGGGGGLTPYLKYLAMYIII